LAVLLGIINWSQEVFIRESKTFAKELAILGIFLCAAFSSKRHELNLIACSSLMNGALLSKITVNRTGQSCIEAALAVLI